MNLKLFFYIMKVLLYFDESRKDFAPHNGLFRLHLFKYRFTAIRYLVILNIPSPLPVHSKRNSSTILIL